MRQRLTKKPARGRARDTRARPLLFRCFAYGECVATCDFCGTSVKGDAPMTWTTAVERGRKLVFCDRCSRDHLRAMEGKLDSEWW